MHSHFSSPTEPGRGGRGGRGPGSGRRGRRRSSEPPAVEVGELRSWLAGNLDDGWFDAPPEVVRDREEILITGTLAAPTVGEGDDQSIANRARIAAFRDDTRDQRIIIADRMQNAYGRKVSWAVRCGADHQAFTTVGVPVMTRLQFDERAVLDTLIAAGVAGSRSEALAWCVRLVGENQAEWIDRLRDAMDTVAEIRDEGPGHHD